MAITPFPQVSPDDSWGQILIDAITGRTEEAKTLAGQAKTDAATAKTDAATAKTDAGTAKTDAASAKTTANTAKTTADTAKTTADTAKSTADTATSDLATLSARVDALPETTSPVLFVSDVSQVPAGTPADTIIVVA